MEIFENKNDFVRRDVQFEEDGITINNLLLSPLKDLWYRIAESTAFVEAASYGDIIEVKELVDGTLLFIKVIEKSPLQTYDFLLPIHIVNSLLFKDFLKDVSADGGYWETLFGGVVNIYLPQTSKINPHIVVEKICKSCKAN